MGELSKSMLEGRDVWLSSQWGFDPDAWGMFGFTRERDRDALIRNTKPNPLPLMVIYITKSAPGPRVDPRHRGKIVGAVELSRELGNARQFMNKESYEWKKGDPRARGRWEFAVRVQRAWKIAAPSCRVADFADITYRPSLGQHIGARGMPLHANEVAKLSTMPFAAHPVYSSSGSAP